MITNGSNAAPGKGHRYIRVHQPRPALSVTVEEVGP